jgi:predicted sugar kinase
MNRSDFLEKDMAMATVHYKICKLCLLRARKALKQGNLELAEKRMEDFQRSLQELHRLKVKKEQYDRIKELVVELKRRGINAEQVVRIF